MDALQITLTLLHSQGTGGENDRGERRAGREEMEMEMGERANKTANGQGNCESEMEQNEERVSAKEIKGGSARWR